MGGRASFPPLEAWDESGRAHGPCHILSQDIEPARRSTYSAVGNVARWTMAPTLNVNEAFKMAPTATRYLRLELTRPIYV